MLSAVIVLLILMVLNGIFAMTELAMMTSRQSRLQAAAQRGSKGAAEAVKLAADPTRLLSTVQVAITLIGIFAGAYGEKSIATGLRDYLARFPVIAEHSEIIALIIVVLGITYLSLVIGELVPKRLALAYPEAVASLISRPLSLLSWIMAAPVKVLTISTELIVRALRIRSATDIEVSVDDMRDMATRAAESGSFDPAEHEILQGALGLGEHSARTLMVPRTDVTWIDKTMRGEEVRALVGFSPYSHFPVCDGALDKVIGVVHIKDMVTHGLIAGEQFDVAILAQPPVFVPETMSAGKLLETLRDGRTHFVFVTSEYGGVSGIVTLNDIASVVIGDVRRHGESEEPEIVEREDGTLLLSGSFSAAALATRLQFPEGGLDSMAGISTTAGIVMTALGRLPVVGESVKLHGWRLEVIDMDGNRIDRVLASRIATPHNMSLPESKVASPET